MNKTLSPQQVRLVAILGLLAVVVLAWWLLVARRAVESSSAPAVVRTHTTPAAPAKPAATPAKPIHPARPATKPAAKFATHGLPVAVAQALRKHRVVVVALRSPGAVVDKLAGAESQAGAKQSGAGFVSINVFLQNDGTPLLHKLGVIDTPAVLVVRRPATIYAQFSGFADRNVIEQAVANARR